MPTQAGTRIGAYEISWPIGVGGMGEVYRARDHRLDRDVALKVLPDELAHDAGRRARFEREARTLAALSHPNIAAIYAVESQGDTTALVMELVEGPTLADRIARGPLPHDEAIAIAVQIADALEAAHERGIVHRDLKPANVKVRPDGTVKVLDFGLAKALAPPDARDDSGVATSPTMTSPQMTVAGLVLGTPAYMSPEQARGLPVDKRIDVWAFGCVLYEMLAARPAFGGTTTTDVLAAVVTRDPDWSAIDAVPSSVRALVRRCLAKNPKERLRDIGDASLELRAASGDRAADDGSTVTRAAARPRASRWRTALPWFAAGALTAAMLSYLARPGASTRPPPAGAIRATIALPPDVTLALGRGSSVALSPDGRQLAYAGRGRQGEARLYLRPLDRYQSQPISGTERAVNPFFSPDGRWIAFFADGKLKKVSQDGGAPVVLADVQTPRGQTWTADDQILLTPTNSSGLARVPSGGGTPQPFTSPAPGEMSHRWPQALPGGTVLFTIWNDSGWDPSRIVAQRAGSTSHAVVVESGGGYPRYVPDPEAGRGYLVFARSEGLLAAPLDLATLRLTASPVPVVDGVITNLSGGAQFDVAANGTLAYVPGPSAEAERDLVWVTRDGTATHARRFAMSRSFALSPDGTRILRVDPVGDRELWIEDLDRGTRTPLTQTRGNFAAAWSEDGHSVAFSRGTPVTEIYRRPADRNGADEQLTNSRRNATPGRFSPDGTSLVYQEIDPVSGSDLWVLTLPHAGDASSGTGRTGSRAHPFVKTNFSESWPVFSPDGRWVAYQSNETGRFEIYARSFPDGQRVVQISTEGGINPAWPPRGSDILYRGTNGMLMAAAVTLSPGLEAGAPRALFDARPYETWFDATADGRRLLMMPLVNTEQSATLVHVVFNFLAELRQRAK